MKPLTSLRVWGTIPAAIYSLASLLAFHHGERVKPVDILSNTKPKMPKLKGTIGIFLSLPPNGPKNIKLANVSNNVYIYNGSLGLLL